MQQPSQLLLPQLKMEANEGKCKVLDKMCPILVRNHCCGKVIIRNHRFCGRYHDDPLLITASDWVLGVQVAVDDALQYDATFNALR